MTSTEWKTAPISPTCEVVRGKDDKGDWIMCDVPTSHVYPAAGRGYMALCLKHALKHDEATPIEDAIRAGEKFA